MKKLLFEVLYQILQNQCLILVFLRDSFTIIINDIEAHNQIMNSYELQKKLNEVINND